MRTTAGAASVLVALVLAAVATGAGPHPARQETPRLLVVPATPAGSAALADASPRVLARYAAFTLVEATGDDVARLRRAGAAVRDDMRQVGLGGRAVDPARVRRGLAGKGARPGTAARLAVVQFVGPVKDEWLTRLRETGARVVSYMAHNAYLVHARGTEPARLAALSRDPVVRAVTPYETADKLPAPLPRSGRVAVVVQTLSGEDGAPARDGLRGGARLRAPSAVGPYRNAFVSLDAAAVDRLAADPGVVAVLPYREPRLRDERASQITAGNLSGNSPVLGPGYLAWLASQGFPATTTDFAVDVTDEGLDTGFDPPSHPDFFEGGSTSNPDRVAYATDWTADSGADAARDCGGHGTINASLIGGYSAGSGSTHEDAAGFDHGLGVAPRVRIGGSKIFRCTGTFSLLGTFTDLTAAAYAGGARISSNSWGADVLGAYNADSQEYDALVRDAQPSVPGNQEMVEVFAAGNAGPGIGTVGSPATAKNVIAVGASENVRPFGTDGCAVSDAGADSARDIAAFSSRGPSTDGRIRPDVVAPGTHDFGAAPQHAAYTGGGVCNKFIADGNTLYSESSGTSHSTPVVSGAAALVRDWYQRTRGAPPSPAMTKAVLADGAADLQGGANGAGGTNANAPTISQGWGRVDLGRSLATTPRVFSDQSTLIGESGQVVSRRFTVQDASQPVRATLVWTDAVGPTTGNAFVNDLDLELEHGSNTFKGNVLAAGQSIPGGDKDPRNNLEVVRLPAGTSGTFSVRVVGAAIGGNGVPGAGDATDQDFALLVSNAAPATAPDLRHRATTAGDAGDGDGVIEPGEDVGLSEQVQNAGDAGATGVAGALTASQSGVQVLDGSAAYPNLAPAAFGANSDLLGLRLAPSFTCGEDVRLTLQLTSAQGSFAVPVTVPTGAPGAPVAAASGDVPKSIPDGEATGVASTLEVAAPGRIKDVDVRIGSLVHTWVGDLRIELTSPGPDPVTVVLAEHPGGFNNAGDGFVETVFDDEAPTSLQSGSAPYTGSFRPQADRLSRFDGREQQGTWTLRVADLITQDTGTLNGWGHELRPAVCAGSGVAVGPASLPAATQGSPYSQGLSATGGTPPHTFSVTSGSLPPGLALSSGGSLSGTPTAPGDYSFTVRADDSASASGARFYVLHVDAAPPDGGGDGGSDPPSGGEPPATTTTTTTTPTTTTTTTTTTAPAPTSGTGTSSPPPAARFTLSTRARRVSRTGVFTYSFVASPRGARGRVAFRTATRMPVGRRRLFLGLGARAFTVPARRTVTVRVRLSRARLALLRRRGRLRVRATATAPGGRRSAVFTLLAPRR